MDLLTQLNNAMAYIEEHIDDDLALSDVSVFRSEKIGSFGAAIPTLFNRAYGEWLPSSGYDKANTADLEIYGIDEDGGLYEEVWIPVKKLNFASEVKRD